MSSMHGAKKDQREPEIRAHDKVLWIGTVIVILQTVILLHPVSAGFSLQIYGIEELVTGLRSTGIQGLDGKLAYSQFVSLWLCDSLTG